MERTNTALVSVTVVVEQHLAFPKLLVFSFCCLRCLQFLISGCRQKRSLSATTESKILSDTCDSWQA